LKRKGHDLAVGSPRPPISNCTEKLKSMTKTFSVGDRAINLTQVLKRAGWSSNGGQAKVMIAEGRIFVNGEVELRKRRKMYVGDVIMNDMGASLLLV
jgi:ribosome-associated protein